MLDPNMFVNCVMTSWLSKNKYQIQTTTLIDNKSCDGNGLGTSDLTHLSSTGVDHILGLGPMVFGMELSHGYKFGPLVTK